MSTSGGSKSVLVLIFSSSMDVMDKPNLEHGSAEQVDRLTGHCSYLKLCPHQRPGDPGLNCSKTAIVKSQEFRKRHFYRFSIDYCVAKCIKIKI